MYDITDLDAGTPYYVRVFAVSSVGMSEGTVAANNPASPSQRPDAPANLAAETVIGNDMELNNKMEVRSSPVI